MVTVCVDSMLQFVPIELLDWVNSKKIYPDNYSNNGSKEYFLKVNLEYPDELHDLHNGYLLSSEKISAKKILPKYQLQIIEKDEFSLGKNEKLSPNLGD